ncbi:E3 SUMO-protein ligase ZBED1-like [Oreochromis aureus]|uniref:E3 SUMO-protein ligase ZBED1-like n=1 Tax=Oreochromis aureus TaxID=47969 RepID=UPI0019535341|nr:E3 SUMO-protein ligase ZBED1-like [Oreochromis aureus]
MKIIDKRYELPSRKYFSKTIIPSMYSTEREKVAAELRYVKHVAATSDLWSSRTMEPYISLTVHYIDNKWELRTRVLETAYFPSDHTGEMVGQGLRVMLSAWDISEEDLVAITTDNGPNIVKAVKLNKWTRVQCFGHRLHLAIENTLKNHPPVERATKGYQVCCCPFLKPNPLYTYSDSEDEQPTKKRFPQAPRVKIPALTTPQSSPQPTDSRHHNAPPSFWHLSPLRQNTPNDTALRSPQHAESDVKAFPIDDSRDSVRPLLQGKFEHLGISDFPWYKW